MTTTATNSSSSFQILNSMHSDYVHHVAFDMYGRKMATCSGDGKVRLLDLSGEGNWKQVGAPWQAHKSSITQLAWAHAEFGALLATCGTDHDVKIWEERQQDLNSSSSSMLERAKLTEARRAVTCCEFAPRQLGLLIATGSSDGSVRVYEAVDLQNLSQWPIQATIVANDADVQEETSLGVTCLSWGTGRFEPPTLVVGSSSANSSSLTVYRYINKSWQTLLSLPGGGTATSTAGNVVNVAWAPNVGRRHHVIAAVFVNQVVVYKLSRSSTTTGELKLESTQSLEQTNNMVSCQWNVTGTVLAISGSGGVVQLYKSDFDGNYKCVSQIHGDLNEDKNNEMVVA